LLALEDIIVEVTQACNHACVHCYNYWSRERAPANAAEALSRTEILDHVRAIRRVSRLKRVSISGGEPLLRCDAGKIAGDLVSEGLEVTVITNGTLLSPPRLRSFPREILFEITLFSSEAEVHDRIAGHSGAFRKIIENAVAVRRRQSGLAVACVLCRDTLAGLADTIELAVALGADGIALNRVNLTANTMAAAGQLVPSAQELRSALDTAESVAQRFDMMFALSVPVPPCVVDPSPYEHLHFGWCPRGGSGAYYTISYNGLVRPCNHSSVILGDIRRQSLAEIVESSKNREFWAPVPPVCQSCTHKLRDSCRGGCPAASHECYGVRNRVDPVVYLAGIDLRETAYDSKTAGA
jgi:radical SAM protein with 4Fe4S-binding SPASM domain